MLPRVNYEMNEDDLKELIEQCKPVLYMVIGGLPPRSPQGNANAAWKHLGIKMGFEYTTVRPMQGKGQRFFSAVPSENKEQIKERTERETKEKCLAEIKKLEDEINARQNRIIELQE